MIILWQFLGVMPGSDSWLLLYTYLISIVVVLSSPLRLFASQAVYLLDIFFIVEPLFSLLIYFLIFFLYLLLSWRFHVRDCFVGIVLVPLLVNCRI